MKIKVQYFNLFGSKRVARMMEEDKLPHNKQTWADFDSLFDLAKRYDVTLRTTNEGVGTIWLTRVFLAQQTTFLPGPSDE